MLEIILWGGVFVASLAVLVKSSEYLTLSAEKIGLFFKLPAFVIGVLIVTLGTSLPELASSIIAVYQGYSEIVAGNVIGSNITNIFLILGIVGIFAVDKKFKNGINNTDLVALIGSIFFLTLAILDRKFSFFEALLSLGCFLIFLYYTVFSKEGREDKEAGFFERIKQKFDASQRKKFPVKSLMVFIFSAFFVFLGAKYTIDSVVYFSNLIQVGKAVIAASVVALGTSLPELAVAWSSARKGKIEVAVGNILGANIFNSLVVMGVSGLVGDLIISSKILLFGLPMMITAVLMYLFIVRDKEITKWEGSFLLIFYFFYIGKIFGWF